MIKKFKQKVIDWFLKDYKRKLELDFIKKEASIDPTDLVREKLKGFDPKDLESFERKINFNESMDILDEVGSDEEILVFLSKAKELCNNDVNQRILSYLIRNQILYSAIESKDLKELNFGRATINGISLYRDEINRLSVLHDERTRSEPKFDEHAIIDTEDKV